MWNSEPKAFTDHGMDWMRDQTKREFYLMSDIERSRLFKFESVSLQAPKTLDMQGLVLQVSDLAILTSLETTLWWGNACEGRTRILLRTIHLCELKVYGLSAYDDHTTDFPRSASPCLTYGIPSVSLRSSFAARTTICRTSTMPTENSSRRQMLLDTPTACSHGVLAGRNWTI